MASIQDAAQHVATCELDLADCQDCETYLFAGTQEFAAAVMDAAFKIVEESIRG